MEIAEEGGGGGGCGGGRFDEELKKLENEWTQLLIPCLEKGKLRDSIYMCPI